MKISAGILVYKHVGESVEVLLAHPAGPIWGHKDFWTIPKGELDEDEDHISAAKREFLEEVGVPVPAGELIDLATSKGSSGKINFIWAVEGEIDVTKFSCNTFTIEWPPKSGIIEEHLENDRAEWFPLATAQAKIFKNQAIFIDRLANHLGVVTAQVPEQKTLL